MVQPTGGASRATVFVVSSSVTLGARKVPSEQVDAAFGMPPGKLRRRAGIESLAYASENEDELTLGTRAAQNCLLGASCRAQDLDWIIATSETHHSYPSLGAQLHSRLLARETCGALDVGGACLGLLNGLAVAQGLIASGRAHFVLVVTADVHSRILAPGRVPGEFGGLFGDGASAFLLSMATVSDSNGTYRLAQFFFGCAGQYAGAIRVAGRERELDFHFDGEALSRAAVTRLEKVIVDLELGSGIPRSSLQGLATHQPNPRLISILAKQCGLPDGKFPRVAQTAGNLGSSTCGAALDSILRSASSQGDLKRGPIFLASLGPGLLYGGGWLFAASAAAD
ncbi:MAG TPA: 3-oxoacyl-[acyl-carrier-protein] synthase III C-terminal domain-containing protein [Candidatus Methylomirabilis sp.]|nr:3-oxoacyl-[acyl-carrier-protein] synthase III C-terminal domain-containing protein [Candidatus Methylomirabilis sp.]